MRLLVAALMLGAIALAVRARAARGRAATEELMELVDPRGPDQGGLRCAPVPACGPQLISDIPAPPVVDAAEACRDAAYLCEGLALRGPRLRALRWSERRAPLHVVVEWPDNVAGQELMDGRHQQGAVRGLRNWSGHALELRVEAARRPVESGASSGSREARPVVPSRPGSRRRPEEPDVVIEWQIEPRTSELGEAYTTWGADRLVGGFGTDFTSAWLPRMRSSPGDAYLTDREVESAAAHMMGHLLGLPHSSSPADVMYPGNSERTPSPEDQRALAALYALPNGAEIRMSAGEGSR
jgi:hypothetical protein